MAENAAATPTATTPKAAPKKTTPKVTPLREREPKVIAEQTVYAAASLIDDAVDYAKGIPAKVSELREQAPTKVAELREQAPGRVAELREQLEDSVKELREKAGKRLDTSLVSFEKSFDARAKDGKKITDRVRKNERVIKLEEQIKAAVSSARKSLDQVVERMSERN